MTQQTPEVLDVAFVDSAAPVKDARPDAPGAPAIIPEDHVRIDALEAAMLAGGVPVEQPVVHRWAPGLYIRQVTNPAGSLVTTKIHKTEHPFFVMRGKLSIWVPGEKVVTVWAPHSGITLPGTRRVLYAHTDVVFVTVHPNPDNGHDLAAIEERLIERRERGDGVTAHEVYLALLAAKVLP